MPLNSFRQCHHSLDRALMEYDNGADQLNNPLAHSGSLQEHAAEPFLTENKGDRNHQTCTPSAFAGIVANETDSEFTIDAKAFELPK